MTFQTWIQSETSARLGQVLLHSLWQIAVIGLFALVLRAMLKSRVQTRYRVSYALLLLMVVAPLVTWFFSSRVEPGSAAVKVPAQLQPEIKPFDELPVEGNDIGQFIDDEPLLMTEVDPNTAGEAANTSPQARAQAGAVVSGNIHLHSSVGSSLLQKSAWLTPLWFVGVLVLAIRQFGGWMLTRKVLKTAKPIADSAWQSRLNEIAAAMGIRRAVKVMQSSMTDIPMVIGTLRPIVVLPVSLLTGLSPAQCEAIFAHELAHVRRYDFLFNLAQIVIETLLFYHPVVWWLSRRIRMDREFCCDDIATRISGSKISLAEGLAALEEIRLNETAAPIPVAPVTVSASGDGKPDSTLNRVSRILNRTEKNENGKGSWVPGSVVLMMLALLATAWGLSSLHAVAKAQRDAAETTVVVAWSAVVDETVLREIRALKSNTFKPAEKIQTEAFRVSARELRSVIKKRLDDDRKAKLAVQFEVIRPTASAFAPTGTGHSIHGTQYYREENGLNTAASWHGHGFAFLESTNEAAKLNLKMEYYFDVNQSNGKAKIATTETINDGRSVGFVITPTGAAKWKPSVLIVYEAVSVPTRQLEFFRPRDSKLWVQNGANDYIKQAARALAWRESVSAGDYRLDAANTQQLPHGGHVQLIAVSRPDLAPMVWWDPAGQPIFVPDPQKFQADWNQPGLALIRIWEDDVRRNVHRPNTMRSSGGIIDIQDPCPEDLGSQMLVVPMFVDETTGKASLKLGIGTGQWTNEVRLPAVKDAKVTINGVEITLANVHEFKTQNKTWPAFRWEPTRKWEFTAVAVTKQGQEIWPTSNPMVYVNNPPNTINGAMTVEHPVLKKDIAHYLIKARPCHWVEFDSFAVEPAIALDPAVNFSPEKEDENNEAQPAAADEDQKDDDVENRKGDQDATTKDDATFGPESHGLRCRLVAVSPDSDPENPDLTNTVNEFDSDNDMTFIVELKNVSDKPISLLGLRYGGSYPAVKGKLNARMFGPCLFECEFTDSDGKPLAHVERRLLNPSHLIHGASLHEVAPGQSLTLQLEPTKFMAPMNHQLPTGKYNVRVRYLGADKEFLEYFKTHRPDSPSGNAWAHEVHSNSVRFSIAPDPTAVEQPELNWGPVKDGLQAAIEFNTPESVEGYPYTAPGVPVGSNLRTIFHVKNVSNGPITFVSETGRQGDGVHVTDAAGEKVDIKYVWHSGIPIIARWNLKPGEVAQLTASSPTVNSIKKPGQYDVSYTIRFNSWQRKDGEGNVILPAKGDWQDELETGVTPLYLSETASVENDVSKTENSGYDVNKTRTLSDAIKQFNEKSQADPVGKDQPPLTEKEVITAIGMTAANRGQFDVADVEFADFQKIAKTRSLPPKVEFEALSGSQPDPLTAIIRWSVRIVMPRHEGNGSYAFVIRDTHIETYKINEKTIAWGQPASNGLAYGVAFDPNLTSYPLNDTLKPIFFLRNEGKAPIKLPLPNVLFFDPEKIFVFDDEGNRVGVKKGHKEFDIPWVAGWRQAHLAPGDFVRLNLPHTLGLGVGKYDAKVGRILDVKQNQKVRLSFEISNYGNSKSREMLRTGELVFTVSLPNADKVKKETPATETADNQPEPAKKKQESDKQATRRAFGRRGVGQLAFANYDKELLTISNSRVATIQRWDIATKQVVGETVLTSDKPNRLFHLDTVTFSKDSQYVAIATDEYVGIWETASGELLRKLAIPEVGEHWVRNVVKRLACSADLTVVAAGMGNDYDRTTKYFDAYAVVWSAETGEVTNTIKHKHAREFVGIDVSSDGNLLATTGGGGTIIWEIASGKQIREIKNDNKGRKHDDPEVSNLYLNHVWSVRFSPDGKLLAIGDTLGAKLWHVKTGQELHQFNAAYRFSSGRSRLIFSRDGKRLARVGTSSKMGGRVPIWSTRTGKKLFELHTRSHDGDFSADGSRFAVIYSSLESKLTLWQLEIDETGLNKARPNIITPQEEPTEEASVKRQPSRAQMPVWIRPVDTDKQFQLAGNNPLILDNERMLLGNDILEIKTGKLLERLSMGTAGFVQSFRTLSANRQFLLVRGTIPVSANTFTFPGDLIQVWDLKSRKQIGKTLSVERFPESHRVECADISPDGQVVAVGAGGHVQLWNVMTGELIKKSPEKLREIDCLKLSPDGFWLGYSSRGALEFWDWQTEKEPERVDGGRHIESIHFSPDSRFVAIGPDTRRNVQIRDMKTLKIIHYLEDKDVRYMSVPASAYTGDGKILVSGNSSMVDPAKLTIPYRLHVWDTETGKFLHRIATPGFLPRALSCTPDGSFITARMEEDLTDVSYEGEEKSFVGVWQLNRKAAPPVGSGKSSIQKWKERILKSIPHSGKTAAELIDKLKPVWGEEKQGIQYGLAVDEPNRKFKRGERVPLFLFVRNVSGKPLHVEFSPDFLWNVPVVTNDKGETIQVKKIAVLGTTPRYGGKLKPGEGMRVSQFSLGIGPNPAPGKQNWYPYLESPSERRYNLKHALKFDVLGLEEGDKPTKEVLTSGAIVFDAIDDDQLR